MYLYRERERERKREDNHQRTFNQILELVAHTVKTSMQKKKRVESKAQFEAAAQKL